MLGQADTVGRNVRVNGGSGAPGQLQWHCAAPSCRPPPLESSPPQAGGYHLRHATPLDMPAAAHQSLHNSVPAEVSQLFAAWCPPTEAEAFLQSAAARTNRADGGSCYFGDIAEAPVHAPLMSNSWAVSEHRPASRLSEPTLVFAGTSAMHRVKDTSGQPPLIRCSAPHSISSSATVAQSPSFAASAPRRRGPAAPIKKDAAMWTVEEDLLFLRLIERHGKRWAKIASHLPGRTDNGVRNRWNRMERAQMQRSQLGGDHGYRCRRCGQPKRGHICAALTRGHAPVGRALEQKAATLSAISAQTMQNVLHEGPQPAAGPQPTQTVTYHDSAAGYESVASDASEPWMPAGDGRRSLEETSPFSQIVLENLMFDWTP